MRRENGIFESSVDLRLIKCNPDTVAASVANVEFCGHRYAVDGGILAVMDMITGVGILLHDQSILVGHFFSKSQLA